jgi:hypothetical protein
MAHVSVQENPKNSSKKYKSGFLIKRIVKV